MIWKKNSLKIDQSIKKQCFACSVLAQDVLQVNLMYVWISVDFSALAESRHEASLITNTVPMYPAFKSECCTANI